MHGSSAESLASLREALTEAVEGGADGGSVGESLFGAAEVLDQQAALRRALTDPSMEGEAKSGLARSVFEPHLDETATDLVTRAAGRRWVAPSHLAQALEQLGVEAVVLGAGRDDEGDRVEDELFDFGQLVATNPDLRQALSDPARTVPDKQGLIEELLSGKVAEGTMRLAKHSVSRRHHTVAGAVGEFGRVAAESRGRLGALVRVAHPLSEEEHERLASILSAQYDKPVRLNTVVEPRLLGGVRVEIDQQVIDGTIAARLDQARRRLAG